ncbi:MAG: chondroitin lyase [Cyclobacteriaceae bacterium]
MNIKRSLYALIFSLTLIGFCHGQSDIQKIKVRIVNELLEQELDDDKISTLINQISSDGSWSDINYEDLSLTGYQNRIHVSNLLLLSKAYSNPTSSFFENVDIKKAFLLAIDFWIKHDFIAANWHTNEIANPRNWTGILLLMENVLSEEQMLALVDMAGRANFDSWGARPGGDQIKIAGIAAELAVFREDEQTLNRAVEVMANEVQISSGNGIKPDFSFHHRVDRVTSILAYGTGYAAAFANWAVRLADTKYRFSERSTKLLVDFYLDGICKSMVHGIYKDPGAMNRGVSRKGYLKSSSTKIALDLMRATDYRKDEIQNILKVSKGEQGTRLSSNRFFWHSEYHSHQRPDYFTSVRMYADRNHNMEYPHNKESLKMHHMADGANFISKTGQEYYDIFPVWDWQKIPGTTVVQKPELSSHNQIVKWGKTDFVGGLTDGIYGASVFDFDSPHDELVARKSWFFFDKEHVCLGAGINSNAGSQVVTTLNQSLMTDEVFVRSGNKKSKLKKGEHSLKEVSWVHDGTFAYIFPEPIDISIRNRMHKGRWQDINKQASHADKDPVEKELFCAWIDHGVSPKNASYQYIVRPTESVGDLDKSIGLNEIVVLYNSTHIQAVQHRGLDLTQIVFYKPGKITLGNGVELSVAQPGLVMVESSGNGISKMSIADPTRKLKSFKLEIKPKFKGKSNFDIMLPKDGNAGKSIVIDESTDLNKLLASDLLPENVEKSESQQGIRRHYIGERYGGGVIIWLDENSEHGIIAATTDSHASVQWKNGFAKDIEHFSDRGDRVTNARGDGIGAGEMNTMIVVAQQTRDRFNGNFAAKVCVDSKQGGYGDWYLPSKAELGLMHEFKEEIGGFVSTNYWSSTEYNVGFVWGLGFKGYKSEYTFNKGSRVAVRCARKF